MKQALSTCLLLTLLTSCNHTAQQNAKTARDVVELAKDACVLIRDVSPPESAAQEICATEEEIRPYVKLILGARRAAAHPSLRSDAGN